MSKISVGTLALLFLINAPVGAESDSSAEKEQTSSKPVATVNGVIITQEDYNDYLKVRMEQTSVRLEPDRETIIKELVNRQLVIQDALKKELDKTADFKRKLEGQRDNLLAATGIRDYLDKNPFTETMLKAEYDKRVKQMNLPKEYKVKHILLQTEDEAKAVIESLNKGEEFAKLAKEKSVDTASVQNGGDLGWVSQQQVATTFATAMITLKKGEYTKTPVQSQFGWHVIALEDSRDTQPPPFENVKKNLEMVLQTQKMQDYVDELRKNAKIEVSGQESAKIIPPPAKPELVNPKPPASNVPPPQNSTAPSGGEKSAVEPPATASENQAPATETPEKTVP